MAEAPAEKSLEILSQELTCSVCIRHYGSPKSLACCHYFCEACLRGRFADESRELACPECESTTVIPPLGISYLPDVRFVGRLKELHTRMAMIQRKKEAVCETCSAQEAGFFCRQCADFMCDDCARSHSRMSKKYPEHCVATLDELQENGARTIPMKTPQPGRCACARPNAVCKAFCRDCRQLVCSDCVLTEHSGHRHEPVKKCASQSRRLLQQNLFPLRIISQQFSESLTRIENTKREIAAQGDHVAHSIRAYFDEAISLLKKEKESLLAQSTEMMQKKLELLNTQEQEVTRSSSIVQNVIEYCKQNADLVSDEDMLMVHNELECRVQEHCSKYQHQSEQSPCETANIAVQTTAVEYLVQRCRERVKVYLFPSENNSKTHTAEVGKETTHCVVDSSDPLDTPHLSSLTASLVSVVDGSSTQATVIPVGKGLYEVCYTPRVRGRHQLWIKRDGKPISDAPFPVFATISPTLLGRPVHSMDRLKHPYSAAFNAQNQLLVTQSGGSGIQKFSRSESAVVSECFTSQWPKYPTGMAIDGEGFVYVVNISTHTLSKFDKDGELVGEIGGEGSDREELDHPSGVAVVGERVYVCDRNNNRIKIYTKELKLLGAFGGNGRGEGKMNWPYDIASDDSGHIYIADSDNHRVLILKRNGEFVRSFGTHGSELGSLNRPTGVCMGRDGLLYIAEYANHRVSVFQTDGLYMGGFGCYGSNTGQLCYPVGLTVDANGYVYVCDQGNNRIQVF